MFAAHVHALQSLAKGRIPDEDIDGWITIPSKGSAPDAAHRTRVPVKFTSVSGGKVTAKIHPDWSPRHSVSFEGGERKAPTEAETKARGESLAKLKDHEITLEGEQLEEHKRIAKEVAEGATGEAKEHAERRLKLLEGKEDAKPEEKPEATTPEPQPAAEEKADEPVATLAVKPNAESAADIAPTPLPAPATATASSGQAHPVIHEGIGRFKDVTITEHDGQGDAPIAESKRSLGWLDHFKYIPAGSGLSGALNDRGRFGVLSRGWNGHKAGVDVIEANGKTYVNGRPTVIVPSPAVDSIPTDVALTPAPAVAEAKPSLLEQVQAVTKPKEPEHEQNPTPTLTPLEQFHAALSPDDENHRIAQVNKAVPSGMRIHDGKRYRLMTWPKTEAEKQSGNLDDNSVEIDEELLPKNMRHPVMPLPNVSRQHIEGVSSKQAQFGADVRKKSMEDIFARIHNTWRSLQEIDQRKPTPRTKQALDSFKNGATRLREVLNMHKGGKGGWVLNPASARFWLDGGSTSDILRRVQGAAHMPNNPFGEHQRDVYFATEMLLQHGTHRQPEAWTQQMADTMYKQPVAAPPPTTSPIVPPAPPQAPAKPTRERVSAPVPNVTSIPAHELEAYHAELDSHPMEWSKKGIQWQDNDGGRHTTDGHVSDSGLGVWPAEDGDSWHVGHAASGVALGDPLETEEEAKRAAAMYDRMPVDWSEPDPEKIGEAGGEHIASAPDHRWLHDKAVAAKWYQDNKLHPDVFKKWRDENGVRTHADVKALLGATSAPTHGTEAQATARLHRLQSVKTAYGSGTYVPKAVHEEFSGWEWIGNRLKQNEGRKATQTGSTNPALPIGHVPIPEDMQGEFTHDQFRATLEAWSDAQETAAAKAGIPHPADDPSHPIWAWSDRQERALKQRERAKFKKWTVQI